MKQILLFLLTSIFYADSYSQGIQLLYKGGGTAYTWNDPVNWIQVNAAVGQAPIQRVPTELDDIIFSGPQSGLSAVGLNFNNPGDSIYIGANRTTGYRCRSMRISNIQIGFSNTSSHYTYLDVNTSNGGRVIIDSGANVGYGLFQLNGGNSSINDLEVRNSNFGSLFSHAAWSTITIKPNGKARFEGSTFGGQFFGSESAGGTLYADSCVFTTTNFRMGDNSTLTLLNTDFINNGNNVFMSFGIGHNAIVHTANVNVTSHQWLYFYTSGAILNGNVTCMREVSTALVFDQKYPGNPRPNIINGNCTFQGGIGSLGIRGDLKISGNFINNGVVPLIYPDTAHVFINNQHIFKIGGITNYRNRTSISNCTQDLCHFKLEFFGNTNSHIQWPVGLPVDTLIVNKTGCAKVTFNNSLYVSGEARIQSGQLVLNPNPGIPYKFVCAGDLEIFPGGGVLLRKNAAGLVAAMAVDGNIIDHNTAVDSACFGLSNPYAGNVTMYLVTPGAGSNSINMASNGNIGNLNLVTSGSAFTLGSNLAVNNLSFSAGNRIQLGNYNLDVNGSISNEGSDRYVVTNGSGALRINNIGNTPRLFPVGVSSSSYTPVTISNAGTPDQFGVNVAASVLPGGNSGSAYSSDVVNRTWHISEGTPGGSNAALTLQWNAAEELTGFNRGTAYVAHHTAGSWDMGPVSPAQGTAPFTLTRGNLTSFSPFAVFGSAATIPVTHFTTTVYPNPVKEKLMIKVEAAAADVNIQLMDAKGVRVRSAKIVVANNNQVFLPVADLPAGIYMLYLAAGDIKETRQILIE